MQTVPRRNWLHRVVNVTVAVILLAVAGCTFFLSYPGVHDVARQGGVSGQLARFYPGLFDAVLVIACVAAVTLRDARWWARAWAWLVAIVVLAAIGFTDVVHAMSYGLRQRPTEGVVAAAPVAAVLLAFSLFLTLLRQSRPRPADGTDGQAPGSSEAGDLADEQPTAPMTFSAVDIVPAVATTVQRPPVPPIALPAVPVADPEVAVPAQQIPALADDAPDAPPADQRDREPEPTEETGSSEESGPSEEPPAATAGEPAESAAEAAAEEPGPQPAAAAPATVPQPIRYASSAAAEQFGDEDWEAEVDPALAGQVYPVLTSDPDIEVPPHEPGQSQDLEDDAPPFATAPFASVPRLNRVRVSPTPPIEEIAVADDSGDGE